MLSSEVLAPARGLQQPRFCSLPPADDEKFGDQAVELAGLAGLALDPWQEFVLRGMLRRAGGHWAAFEACQLVPRQNGKSVILEAYDLAKLFLCNPPHLILHTAHLFPTAMESFRHLVGLVMNTPELRAEVARVSKAHGEEGFELVNGSRLRFAARTVSGAGRGFSPDTVVFDEAYRLPHEAMAALRPALSAKPDPQIVYASSTGYPESEILWSLVQRGRSGVDPSLAYMEWSADPGCDYGDLGAWAQANPALGYRLSENKITAERAGMQDEDFARERLGLWADTLSADVIPPEKWAAVADLSRFPAPHVGKTCLAVDTDPARARSTLAVAGIRGDGLPMVEIVENGAGVEWVSGRIRQIWSRNDMYGVAVDRRSAAASLIPALETAKVRVLASTAAEMAQACGQFYDAVVETARIRHLNDPRLNAALKSASARPLSDAWAWDKKTPTGDITPLTAATLALWGWARESATLRNAGRGRVIGLD